MALPTLANVAYRLTVMQNQTVDPTESTPLTPIAGSVHSDPFQVATVQGLVGYAPYLDLPTGRKAVFDPISCKFSTGIMNFRLLDKRTNGTSNLERWVTAFIGNEEATVALKGCRVIVEECVDWNNVTKTGTWTPFYAGRLTDATLTDPLWYQISVKDGGSYDLELETFKGKPSALATSTVMMAVLPQTLTGTYGPYSPDSTMTGVITSSAKTSNRVLSFDARSLTIPQNRYPRLAIPRGTVVDNSDYVLRIQSGSTIAEYDIAAGGLHGRSQGDIIVISSVEYIVSSSATTITLGSLVTGSIVAKAMPLSSDNPLFINDIHPAQLMKEVVSGYYGYLTPSGSLPLRSIAIDNAAFDNLINDATYPTVRFAVTKKTTIDKFIESQLCPFGIGYRVDTRTISGSIVPVFVPFDNRLPASSSYASMPVITDADIADMSQASWQMGDPISLFSLRSYNELYTPFAPATKDTSATKPKYQEVANTVDTLHTVNGSPLSYDLQGIRCVTDDQASVLAAESALRTVTEHLYGRFSKGVSVIELSCRRTDTIRNLNIGDWCKVSVSVLPDPTSNQRGGIRLMQVTQRTEKGPTIVLQLLDSGEPIFTPSPIVGSPFITADNDGFYLPVSGSIGQRVNIQVATMPYGSITPPPATSSLWQSHVYCPITASGMGNYFVMPTSWDHSYFMRARLQIGSGRLPSAWVDGGLISVSAPAAPVSMSVSVSGSNANVSWQNPVTTTATIEVALASPTGSNYTVLDTLQPGSTAFTVKDLTNAANANPYGVLIRYKDAFGSYSSAAVQTFTITAAPQKCPALTSLYAVSNTP